ncbi:MAG: hypothetical protein QNK20_16750 [Aureibaculum sp.]|nr:hypothetical protein [Aureibaculum sp.]
MSKDELIKLYISDLESHCPTSRARDNRIAMLESELEIKPSPIVKFYNLCDSGVYEISDSLRREIVSIFL